MSNKDLIIDDDPRRQAIIACALKCFLQYGYEKTSIEDIAKEVKLSRPLIYLKFKNKECLYRAVINSLSIGRYERAERILTLNITKKEKLNKIFDIFLIDTWQQMFGKPMLLDYYKINNKLFDEIIGNHKNKLLKLSQLVFRNFYVSKIFVLAVEGLKSDYPNTKTLKKRLRKLIDIFIPGEEI